MVVELIQTTLKEELEIIKHGDISRDQVEDVIIIKSTAWNYSLESQIKWLRSNLKENDLHVFLTIDNNKVAYANLLPIEVKIDERLTSVLGVGNVVAKDKGRGNGSAIIREINKLLKKKNKPGLLFCQKELILFYDNHFWNEIPINRLEIPAAFKSGESIITMAYNLNINFTKLSYSEKLF
jgi:hypothetical protein